MKKIRIISITLIVLVIVTAVPCWATANETTMSLNSSDIVDAKSVPEILPYESVIMAGHVKRLYSEEDSLHSIVFQNSDNTQTLYLFNEEVKFINDNGDVVDKSNRLYSDMEGAYANYYNDIKVKYPSNIKKGVKLEYDDLSFAIRPVYNTKTSSSVELQKGMDSVVYSNVFNENTCIQYKQTFSGYKEEIILNDRTGQSIYEFELDINGYEVVQSDGDTVVIKDEEVVGRFGSIIAFDANNRYTVGELMVETISMGRQYRLSVILPEEYLADPETVYPVVIDPSFDIVSSSDTKVIEDATIFTNHNSNFGSWFTLFVGNFNAYYPGASEQRGIARTLLRFSGLNSSTLFNRYYNSGRVTSIKYNFCSVHAVATNTIRAFRMTSDWEETTAVYSPSLWSAWSSTPSDGYVTISAHENSTPYPRHTIEIKNIIDYVEHN